MNKKTIIIAVVSLFILFFIYNHFKSNEEKDVVIEDYTVDPEVKEITNILEKIKNIKLDTEVLEKGKNQNSYILSLDDLVYIEPRSVDILPGKTNPFLPTNSDDILNAKNQIEENSGDNKVKEVLIDENKIKNQEKQNKTTTE